MGGTIKPTGPDFATGIPDLDDGGMLQGQYASSGGDRGAARLPITSWWRPPARTGVKTLPTASSSATPFAARIITRASRSVAARLACPPALGPIQTFKVEKRGEWPLRDRQDGAGHGAQRSPVARPRWSSSEAARPARRVRSTAARRGLHRANSADQLRTRTCPVTGRMCRRTISPAMRRRSGCSCATSTAGKRRTSSVRLGTTVTCDRSRSEVGNDGKRHTVQLRRAAAGDRR